MPVEYTNRKRKVYFLHAGKTKKGKRRYYFSPKSDGDLVEEIPEGFEICESPNAVVSLRKTVDKAVTEGEVETLEREIGRHEHTKSCIVEVKGKTATVFEPDKKAEDISKLLSFGIFSPRVDVDDILEKTQRYTPVLRFTVQDEERRLFVAERYCFRGSVEGWIVLSGYEKLGVLAKEFVKHVGRDTFFELY